MAMIIVEVEIRSLKIYSPQGPRNGAVIIFLNLSCKNLWLTKILEIIALSNSDSISTTPSPSPLPLPNSPHPRTSNMITTITPPLSPTPAMFHMRGRRSNSRPSLLTSNTHPKPFKHADSSMSGMRDSPILLSRSCYFTFDQKVSPEMKYVHCNVLLTLANYNNN